MAEWTILTREGCGWCDKAKALLKEHDIDFKEIDVNKIDGMRNVIRGFQISTVPQVFRDGHRIGGYEDTNRYLEGF